jgi:uncharacterized protein YbaR (Trm112 family)
VHIELTEMLRCPEPHAETFLVLSTGTMLGRLVRSGVVACPACEREYPIVNGVVHFSGGAVAAAPPPVPPPAPDGPTLQALLDLGGPGGYVVLLGRAARYAADLAGLMGGIHFVGVNAPADLDELPVLSLLRCEAMIPLRRAMARGVVVGSDRVAAPWLAEAQRVLLPGRRLVIEAETVTAPPGVTPLAAGRGLWVGEKR